MFKDITDAITNLQTKGIKFNIGFSDDSYWKIFTMLIGVCAFAFALKYVFGNKAA